MDVDRHLTGFEGGHIENIIDNSQQLQGRAFGGLQKLQLFLGIIATVIFDQLNRTENAVEGGAQFVGNRRQKLTFELVGGFGFLPGRL